MPKLLERNIASVDERLVLLAPPGMYAPASFKRIDFDFERHEELVREVQRFRGGIYLEDGALQPHQLSPEGLHETAADDKSWHILMLNAIGRVTACAWYRDYDNSIYFDRLIMRSCALAQTRDWRDKLWTAVESEIASARRDGLNYAELGGWAVSKEERCTPEGVVFALAVYGLSRICGGALGITTATVRHGSSAILRRIGGRCLEVDGQTVPSYYDPKYRCEMEILRFDSREPSARFSHIVEMLRQRLSDVLVVARPCWPMAAGLPNEALAVA